MKTDALKATAKFTIGYIALSSILIAGIVALDLLPRDGKNGADGAPGQDGSVKTYIAQTTFNGTPTKKSGTATCKAGDLVVGGGGGGGHQIVYSYPASKSSWYVMVYCAGCNNYEVRIYAICTTKP